MWGKHFGGEGVFLFLAGYRDVTAPVISAKRDLTVQADVCSLFYPLWAAEAGPAHDMLRTGTPWVKGSTQGLG